MTGLERDLQLLHRYHDGELSGLERWRFERRLRRSPALRAELVALRAVSAGIARAGLDPEPAGAPDLWATIASALPAIDAQVAGERGEAARRGRAPGAAARPPVGLGRRREWLGLPGWVAGATAVAAVAVAALVLVSRLPEPAPGGVPGPMVARGDGVVRYIDSGGAPVLVIEDEDAEMTIVWMMEAV